MPLYNPPTPGQAITLGTYAGSRPASPATGDRYEVTDGWWAEEWTGAAWQPYGPRFPLTNPLLRTWSWFNQGTATVDTSRGAIILKALGSSGNQLRIYEEPISGNYTVTLGFLPLQLAQGQAPNQGLVVRDSVGGKAIELGVMDNNGQPTIRVDQWTSATTWSGNVFSATAGWMGGGGLHWLQIQDNGTNRIYRVSVDGVTWVQVYTEGRTTWCTPDRRGMMVSPQTSSFDCVMTALSWAVS